MFSESRDDADVVHGDTDLETIAEAVNDTRPPSDVASMANVGDDDDEQVCLILTRL